MIAVASLLLAPLPDPGWGTFIVGLAIQEAGELRTIARLLDRSEMKLGGPARRAKVVWTNLPTAIRLSLGVMVPICGAALGLWALLSSFRWLM